MANNLSKQIKSFIAAAESQGFRTKPKKSGVMVFGRDGGAVMLHHTPSDSRGVNNARARLRTLGVCV